MNLQIKGGETHLDMHLGCAKMYPFLVELTPHLIAIFIVVKY
jgi:hypothetical protein